MKFDFTVYRLLYDKKKKSLVGERCAIKFFFLKKHQDEIDKSRGVAVLLAYDTSALFGWPCCCWSASAHSTARLLVSVSHQQFIYFFISSHLGRPEKPFSRLGTAWFDHSKWILLSRAVVQGATSHTLLVNQLECIEWSGSARGSVSRLIQVDWKGCAG